jgi:MFS transporter, DHA3 family, tetracycline resistance protein
MPSSAYRAWLWICLIGSFCNSLIFTVTAVYFVKEVGLNPFQLVFVGTVMELTIFLFEVPTGAVADAFGRKISVIISTILCGGAFLVVGGSRLFATVLLGYVIWGVGATFASGALEAWIVDESEGKDLDRVFLRGGQIGAVGSFLGIILSITLASISLALPLLTGGALQILGGIALFYLMPETRFHPEPKSSVNRWTDLQNTLRSGVGIVRRTPLLVRVLCIAASFGMFTEGLDRLWEAHFLTNFGFPSLGDLDPVVWFGIIGCCGLCLSYFASGYAARRPPRSRHDSVMMLIVLDGVLFLCAFGFALATNFFMALVFYLAAATARSLDRPIFAAWLNQDIPSSQRATVLSIVNQSDAVGQWVGGPVIGAFGTFFSLRAALSLGAFTLVPAVWLYIRTLVHTGEKVAVRNGMTDPLGR